LSQIREGGERPVAYCSRQLNSAESKYSVTELELSAFCLLVSNFDVIYTALSLLCTQFIEPENGY